VEGEGEGCGVKCISGFKKCKIKVVLKCNFHNRYYLVDGFMVSGLLCGRPFVLLFLLLMFLGFGGG
jgi:hypothetical protein